MDGMEHQPETASWQEYHERLRGRPPRPTLRLALKLFGQGNGVEPVIPPCLAVDLGCGAGQDTLALLEVGWTVLALDRDVEVITELRTQLPTERQERLQIEQATFEEVQLPEAHLFNASFSLPFCSPEAFPDLWTQIAERLSMGGYFA